MPRLHLCECTAPTLQEDMVEGGAELEDVVRDEGEDLRRLILASAIVLAEVERVGLAHLLGWGIGSMTSFYVLAGRYANTPKNGTSGLQASGSSGLMSGWAHKDEGIGFSTATAFCPMQSRIRAAVHVAECQVVWVAA